MPRPTPSLKPDPASCPRNSRRITAANQPAAPKTRLRRLADGARATASRRSTTGWSYPEPFSISKPERPARRARGDRPRSGDEARAAGEIYLRSDRTTFRLETQRRSELNGRDTISRSDRFLFRRDLL